MITWMQRHRKYLVITIWISTIAFVGAGFVGWGVYDFNMDRAAAVAKVGNKKVTIKELNRAYSDIYNYYNELLKGKLTQEKAKEMDIRKIALKQLINQAMMLNFADEMGLVALDEEVIAKMESIKAFQKKGVFDKDQYYMVLKNIGMKPKEFENSLKKDVLLDKIGAILETGIVPLEMDLFCSSMFLSDKISMQIIDISGENISFTEDELKKFWESNKVAYMTKKSYDLATIDTETSKIEVSKDEIKEYYNSKKYNYKDDEGKILSYEDAKADVKKDVQFKKGKKEALKKYLSLKKGKIEATGTLKVYADDKSFPQEKLLKAKKDEVVKPIRLDNKYIVAKLLKANFSEPMNYESAKEFAKKDLIVFKRNKMLQKRAKEALVNFNGEEIGFVSVDDAQKIQGLNKEEASDFLHQVFSDQKLEGYAVFKNKAVAYKILEQKLLDKEKLTKYDMLLKENIKKIKEDEIRRGLLASLQDRYEVEKFYKE